MILRGASVTPDLVSPEKHRVWQHLLRYQPLWLAGLFIMVSGALLAVALLALRAQEIESHQRTLDAFARVIEEMTARSLQIAHLRLEQAGSEIGLLENKSDKQAVLDVLRKHLQEMPFANTMWVLDANGVVVAGSTPNSNGIDASRRDYFQALRNAPRDRLVIGKPALGTAEGRMRLPMAHTLHNVHGEFQGVVVVGIDPAYFARAWASVDLGPDYVVALVRRDGILMLRSPLDNLELGRPLPDPDLLKPAAQAMQQGRLHRPGAFDRVPRYFSIRALQAWPDLRLVVGQAEHVVLAPWRQLATVAFVIWVIVSAAVGGLSLYLQRARARHAAEARHARTLGALFDMATSATSIGVWDWDMLTDQAYGSPSYYTMLGYPAQDGVIDRQFWFDRCHPEDIGTARQAIREALDSQLDAYQYQVRLRHADGTYRWTRLIGRVTERDAQGRPSRILGVRTDIHQQVLAEEALRKSEALNQAVLDSVQAQIAVLDSRGTILALNAPWRQSARVNDDLAGPADAPVVVGANYLDICRQAEGQASGSGVVTRIAEGVQDVMERRAPSFTITYPRRTPQENHWFAIQATPLQGAYSGVVIAHTDITERVAAEENLRQLMRLYALRIQINRAIIGRRDRQDLLQEICRVAVAHGQFGMAWIGQADAATGRIQPLAEAVVERSLLPRLTDPSDGRIDATTIPLPRSVSAVRNVADIASKSARWPVWVAQALECGFHSATAIGFAMESRQDASLHLFAREPGLLAPAERQLLRDIGRDISLAVAAVASEAAREKAELALHTLLRDKEALLKEVHHRVKNNLQVVSSLLRLESSREVAPATASVLRDMQGRIQAMALLHESLYGSGNFAAVDLAAYLRKLATQAFTTFSTRTGAVSLQLELEAVEVTMDQAITCGLLVNELVSNSLKHGFPGGRNGEVRITLRTSDTPGHMVLEIADNGVGLPPDVEDRKLNSLGLQLAYDLASQLGGELQRQDGPGAGFAVHFQADASG